MNTSHSLYLYQKAIEHGTFQAKPSTFIVCVCWLVWMIVLVAIQFENVKISIIVQWNVEFSSDLIMHFDVMPVYWYNRYSHPLSRSVYLLQYDMIQCHLVMFYNAMYFCSAMWCRWLCSILRITSIELQIIVIFHDIDTDVIKSSQNSPHIQIYTFNQCAQNTRIYPLRNNQLNGERERKKYWRTTNMNILSAESYIMNKI